MQITPLLRIINLPRRRPLWTLGKNKVQVGGSILRRCRFDIRGESNEVQIGDLSRLTGLRVTIRGNNSRIVIGDHVRVNHRLDLWADAGSVIEIGDYSTFESAHLAATEHSVLRVGEDSMFATDIEVRTGDSHSVITRSGQRVNPSKDVIIGRHVWIGSRATVLKGADLPDDTIVGSGAIVTRAVEKPGSVLVGNPARVVRSNMSWHRDRV